jgi:PAS domain S-box-containing protein
LDDLQPDPASSVFSPEEIRRLCMDNLVATHEARLFFKDRESRFLLVSAGWRSAYGQGRLLAEIVGKTDHDFFGQKHFARTRIDELRVLESGEPLPAELERLVQPGRADVWVQSTKLPLRDRSGAIVGTWGFGRDVTAEVEADRALEASREDVVASERVYRVMFEQNPHPTVIYDRETLAIVDVNHAGVSTYGYSREEFLAMTIKDVMPPERVTGYMEAFQPARGEQAVGLRAGHVQRHRYKDGTVVDVELTSNDVVLNGRACRVASSQDVTERNRVAAEVAAARDEAVEASNLKSAFLATISHEIRTPMNGVLGMNELLLDTDLDPEQRELADQVSRSGELMLELVNDILDISRIEAGQLELEVIDYRLREAIDGACAAARLQADAKGLEFVLVVGDELPEQARGDGRRLRQVLLNVVGNAVKFTSEGTIAVRAGSRPGEGGDAILRVEVSDTGIGIEPEVLQRMFEPFTQADASTTRTYGGSGLGLAIARELVELMGGVIGAVAAPGRGSTFWFELPLAAATVANGNGSGNRPRSQAAERVLAGRPLWSTTPLVLVAEDSPVNQIVAVRTLERCGCEVAVADDGRIALEMLGERKYDLVLMDCEMREMDGFEATAELRRREKGGVRTPIVAMTARAMDGDREHCLAAGMDDYLSKPIRREELVDALQRWLPEQWAGDDVAAGLA